MTTQNTNSTPEQTKAPVQAPGVENKTPEQLALDKKNEASKSAPNADAKKDGNERDSTENKA